MSKDILDEAADRIEAQAAEIAELKAALNENRQLFECIIEGVDESDDHAIVGMAENGIKRIDAVLTR